MKVKLSNVGIISHCDVEFVPGVNLIIGSSGSGKSTLMKCLYNVVMNNFTDADISFNKSNMSVSVITDNSSIVYERSTSKAEKSKYIINDETYVKLGRSALPAVTESLKLGDININGDDINFNFNLQFSSPFLIFGSQSTLYNVLTYRSTFDIASINDLYNQDVKSTNSDITYNNKLKEKLQESLSDLEHKEAEMAPIEKVYCRYTNLKHEISNLNEIKLLHSSMITERDIQEQISVSEKRIKNINDTMVAISDLMAMNKYKTTSDALRTTSEMCSTIETSILSHNNAITAISSLIEINEMLDHSKLHKRLDDKIKFINEYSSNLPDNVEQTMSDLNSLCKKLNDHNKIVYTLGELSYKNLVNGNEINDLINIYRKLLDLSVESAKIDEYSGGISKTTEQLKSFKICPLCEKPMDNGDHHG